MEHMERLDNLQCHMWWGLPAKDKNTQQSHCTIWWRRLYCPGNVIHNTNCIHLLNYYFYFFYLFLPNYFSSLWRCLPSPYASSKCYRQIWAEWWIFTNLQTFYLFQKLKLFLFLKNLKFILFSGVLVSLV